MTHTPQPKTGPATLNHRLKLWMPRTNKHNLTDQDLVGSTEPDGTRATTQYYGDIDDDDFRQQQQHLHHHPAFTTLPYAATPSMTATSTSTNTFSYPQNHNNNAVHGQIYPHYSSFFDFNEAGTAPTDSLLTSSDAQFANPTAGGDYSWSQSDAWDPGNTSGFAIDTNLSSSRSLMRHGPDPSGMPMAWGMNNYEQQQQQPMGATAWLVAGSPSPYSTHESPMSARPSNQSNARTTPSSNRRPSLARYHSSGTTTFQLSPSSTVVEPTIIQRDPRADLGRPGRPSKRRKSGLEQLEGEGSSGGSHQEQYSTAGRRTPMALSAVPTPSPKNAIMIPEYAPPEYQQTNSTPPQYRQDFPIHQQHQHQQLQGPEDYNLIQTQAGFIPPRQLPPIQQQPPPQALRERNRAAANKCRRKSKAVVADLEATERELAEEHRQLSQAAGGLREEVLALKSALLVHGHCEDEVIQQYFANSARLVGSSQGQTSQPQRGGGSSFLSGPSGSGSRGRPSGYGGGMQEGSQGGE